MSPVADCLDSSSLRALVDLRAPSEAAERIEYLAGRANEGLLSSAERDEYQSLMMFGNFLGILQSKARKLLNGRN